MKKLLFLFVLAAISISSSAQIFGYVKQEGGYTNVRRGPGTSYDIVTKIKDGSGIYYEPYNNSWCKVFNNSKLFIGYMHSSKIVSSNAGGGVPSIPSRSTTTRSSGTAWGTQYDWLSQKYATYNDIAGYDKGQLRVLRNSIYARHGRIFKDASLRSYFNSQPWYNGWRSEVPASELNKFEKYNISFIQKYE